MDESTAKGMTPEALAIVICDSIANEREDVVVADSMSCIAITLKNSFPELLSAIMRKRAHREAKKYL
jgi:hypothetical protein